MDRGAEAVEEQQSPPPAQETSTQPTPSTPSTSSLSTSDAPDNGTSSHAAPTPSVVSDSAEQGAAMDHDSLVSIRLSEPPELRVNTNVPSGSPPSRESLHGRNDDMPHGSPMHKTEEERDEQEYRGPEDDSEPPKDAPTEATASRHGTSLRDELNAQAEDEASESEEEAANDQQAQDDGAPRNSSDSDAALDWEQLQKTEDEQSKSQDQDQDPEKTAAMLLARLERENSRLAKNPKSFTAQSPDKGTAAPRPKAARMSMSQLRQMVHGPTPPALRYSILPPPAMTDLEFYRALVQDPQQTAARLPTLLSTKVRKGIPPPLRGVVWQSMSGARDRALEDMFDRLSGETSPYEGIIGKDLGRSFPGVEMFRDPEGEGQRMLGRVLRCFSLYDAKIGYCQGLAFLVGPLLMHMPAKQAFCVLVRLMENYDLRQCFLPDLSGLHVRIYQFREMLRQDLPALSAHMAALHVEPAYVSQWFLSFFATTCPLPLLFRIYDVIFAEGASETLMRVALALMHKNQARILACSEFEDVMQLMLSRTLWSCYSYDADQLVADFASLSETVTRQRLTLLEQTYRGDKLSAGANDKDASASAASGLSNGSLNAARASDVTATAASRFLGRIWASSGASSSASSSSQSASTPTIPSSNAPGASRSSSATSTRQNSSSSRSSNNNNNNNNNNTHSSSIMNTSATLSPGLSAPSRPLSMLRRSTSKQSLASTLNSLEAGSSMTLSSSASVSSSTSTDATSITRDSSTDELSASGPGRPAAAKSTVTSSPQPIHGSGAGDDSSTKHLHSQIEDLLTALGNLQRNHALLASQLQKEREDRDEDAQAVRSLLAGLHENKEGAPPQSDAAHSGGDATGLGVMPNPTRPDTDISPVLPNISVLMHAVEMRLDEAATAATAAAATPTAASSDGQSTGPQTSSQVNDELARTKEQLSGQLAKTQDCDRRISELEQELATTKDQLRESHAHVRNLHQEKQRLEKQMHGMRVRASDTPAPTAAGSAATAAAEMAGEWFSRATGLGGSGGGAASGAVAGNTASMPAPAPASGLRELKLGRTKSTPTQAPSPVNRRTSMLVRHAPVSGAAGGSRESVTTTGSIAPMLPVVAPIPEPAPAAEHEAVLMELAQAKTAEAIARQEAEEYKQKFEHLRRSLAQQQQQQQQQQQHSEGSAASRPATTMAAGQSHAQGGAANQAASLFGRLTGSASFGTAPTPDVAGKGSDAGAGAGAALVPASPTPAAAAATTGNSGGGGGFWGWRR